MYDKKEIKEYLNLDDYLGPIQNGYVHGDSIDLIRKVPDSSVHLILSDIPYGIGADDWDVLHDNSNSALLGSSPAQERAGAIFKRRGKPINGWSEADGNIPREYYEWCSKWASEWLRVLKPGGSAFIFAGRRYSHRCISALEDAGFNFRDMLGWNKTKAPYRAQRLGIVFDRRGSENLSAQWQNWRLGNLRPIFEPIIWCQKPYKKTVADNVIEHSVGAYNHDAMQKYFNSIDNIFTCGMDCGESGFHPTQKPIKLMMALIELATIEGHVVLDPFCGSGSTLVAAKRLGRKYLGFEKDPQYIKKIGERMGE